MSFLRPSSRSIRIFIGLALFVAVILAFNYVTGGSISRVLRIPLAPVQSAENSVRSWFGERLLMFRSKVALEGEVAQLKEENAQLELLVLNNLALRSENEELRALLKVRPASVRTLYTVRVLSDVGAFTYGTLVLGNPGKKLEPGTFVFGPNNTVLGTVLDGENSAITMHLLSASGRETQARIGDESTPVTVIGLGQGNFTTQVPRGVEIAVGDHVILPEAQGALLGVVGSIEVKDTDAFQTVLIRVPLSIPALQFVSL